MPEIDAPIATRQLQRSTISGSRAAFSMTEPPFAVTAAMTAFSVAPTETIGNVTRPPLSRPPGAIAFT